MVFNEALFGDPGNPIYPVGDERNPKDPGAGLSGKRREATCEYPVPGERFTISGCFDDEACIALFGEDGCRALGGELFQTVGFMGGQIHDVFDEERRIYEVMVDGVLTGAQGTDLTKYQIGQWVALAKPGTEFPVNEWEERVPVTDANVPTVGIEDYIIIPYQFAGV